LLAKHARRAGMSRFSLPSSGAPAAKGPAAGGALAATSKWRVASKGVADYQVHTRIRLPGYPPPGVADLQVDKRVRARYLG